MPFRNSERATQTAIISCFGYSNRTDIFLSHYRCFQITAKALLKSLSLAVCMHTDDSGNPKKKKRNLIKFRIEESYKTLSSYPNFHLNRTLLKFTLYGDLHAFLRARTYICPFREQVRSRPVIAIMLSTYS